MGWASRAREAAERTELRTYVVKQWTAFAWTYPEGKGKSITAKRNEMRKDREDHLKRAADMMDRKLRDICESMSPKVKQVKVKREPQLLFEFTVKAVDEHDARRRAVYRIQRALSVRVPTGRRVPAKGIRHGTGGYLIPERVRLTPPMGDFDVTEKLTSARKRKAAA